MFGIGFWETIIIIIVMILVVKPDDIPNVVYKVGKFIGELKKSYDMFIDTLHELEDKVKQSIEFEDKLAHKTKTIRRRRKGISNTVFYKRAINVFEIGVIS